MSEQEVNSIFESFKGQRILIIGDIMIDAYLWGEVNRISPEAPVPVVAVRRRENRLGGAANVARNIKALGAEPVLCSVIGDDFKGDEFLQLLEEENMPQQGILRSEKRVTTTKFRVLGNNTQMLRVDEEMTQPLDEADNKSLIKKTKELVLENNIDAVIFQDYDKGVISAELISETTKLANEKGIPVTVDPKRKHFMDYQDVTLFKPNLKELKEGLQTEFDKNDMAAIESSVELLQSKLHCKMLMVTLSENGIYFKYGMGENGKTYNGPAHKRDISDVSGAGDTVISTATLCLALELPPADIAAIANLAGGLVCEEAGVVPINPEKLKKEVIKIYNKL